MKTFHINNLFLEKPKQFGDVLVYQIGVLQSDDKTVFDTHIHDNFFELTIIIGGSAEISANGKSLPLGQGDIFLSYPFDTHKIVSISNESLKYYFLAFDTVNTKFRFQLDNIVKRFSALQDRQFKNNDIASYVSQAVYETTQNDAFNDEYCAALLLSIIIRLIRQYISQSNSFHLPSKNESFAYAIMNYINSHIYSMKSLTELCSVFGYEYSHISKLFTKTTGQTLTHYFRIQRLETARSLISKGSSVSEIAKSLNYSSVYSFSCAFKKQYNVSPLNYKKNFQISAAFPIAKLADENDL